MDNLDVQSIFFNFLWIIGLSVLLATWSYAYYEARITNKKVREKFDELPYALVLDAGLLLFVAGLVATESRGWARWSWIVTGGGFIIDAVMRVRANKQPVVSSPAHGPAETSQGDSDDA